MATQQELEYEEKKRIEEEAVSLAAEKYDGFIEFAILIGISAQSRRDKIRKIDEEFKKLKAFNEKFSAKTIEEAYSVFAKKALDELGAKKKLKEAQNLESKNLQSQMQAELDKRLSLYYENAKRLILMEELRQLRESRLNFQDGRQRVLTSSGRLKSDLLFQDSRGRVVKNEVIMKIAVGDQVWGAMQAGVVSSALLNGVTKGIHKSVIDDKTTDICLELDGKIRDLRKDKLPPMHPNCRSEVILLIES